MIDTKFQFKAIKEKIEQAKMSDAKIVCKAIDDIRIILELMDIDVEELRGNLSTAYDIADISLGFGHKKLNSLDHSTIKNLIRKFESEIINIIPKI